MLSDIAMGIGLGKSSPNSISAFFQALSSFPQFATSTSAMKVELTGRWSDSCDSVRLYFNCLKPFPYHSILSHLQRAGSSDKGRKQWNTKKLHLWSEVNAIMRIYASDLGFKQLVYGARSIRLQCSSTIGTYSCMQFRKLLKTITASEEKVGRRTDGNVLLCVQKDWFSVTRQVCAAWFQVVTLCQSTHLNWWWTCKLVENKWVFHASPQAHALLFAQA